MGLWIKHDTLYLEIECKDTKDNLIWGEKEQKGVILPLLPMTQDSQRKQMAQQGCMLDLVN